MISAKDFKPYKKESDISYTIGIFPTIELITQKPDNVVAVLYAESAQNSNGFAMIKQQCEQNGLPLILTKRVQSIAKSENAYVVGVFRKYDMKLSAAESHIVLVEPDDMGNIGTILRSMVGFDYHNVAIIGQAADFWNPKTVRACMGSIFKCNVSTFATIQDYRADFPDRQLYSFMLGGMKSLSETGFVDRHSLVFGNEGAGLSSEYAEISQPVHIEQSEDIDSLNLSIAASVVMHWIYANKAKK